VKQILEDVEGLICAVDILIFFPQSVTEEFTPCIFVDNK
jgi:hypothetical protein